MDQGNLAILDFLGLHDKNIAAVNIRMRPQRTPLITVQYHYLGEYGSNREPSLETRRFQLVEQSQSKGQTGVLCDLLRECVNVIDTIDPDDEDEFDNLCDLTDKCQKAIDGISK